MSSPTVLVNGLQTPTLAVGDRGLSYGDGLFETTAAFGGAVRFASRHLARLEQGCKRLGIPPPERSLVQQEMHRLAAAEPRAVIKVVVTRGSGGAGYAPPLQCQATRIVQRLPWPKRNASDYTAGIDVGVCSIRVGRQPALAGIKHLNRLEQVLGRSEMVAKRLAEGIMLDEQDNVIEATAANVFAVCDGVLVTPRLDVSGVRGVMRDVVLDTARELKLPVRCGRLELLQLINADEVFLTNSLAGLLPVRSLIAARWQPGPVAAAIAAALANEHIQPCGAA